MVFVNALVVETRLFDLVMVCAKKFAVLTTAMLGFCARSDWEQ